MPSLRSVALFAVMLAIGVSPARASEPIKVAFIYVDPVGDTGWSYQHDMARREVERVLGSQVKTTYVESVPATADAVIDTVAPIQTRYADLIRDPHRLRTTLRAGAAGNIRTRTMRAFGPDEMIEIASRAAAGG